jgi:hypothetical protein
MARRLLTDRITTWRVQKVSGIGLPAINVPRLRRMRSGLSGQFYRYSPPMMTSPIIEASNWVK